MRYGIIAFCGSKGSGKSTSSSIFKELFKGPTEELTFAGYLKQVCSDVFGIDMKYFTDPSLKETELDTYINLTPQNVTQVVQLFNLKSKIDFLADGFYDKHIRPHIGQVFYTPRQVLQYIGTDVLHPIDPLIHVKVTLATKDSTKLSIVTDLRFLQEFDAMAKRDDFLPVYVKNQRAEMAASTDTHKSEQDLKKFTKQCILLDNDSSLGDLTQRLAGIIEEKYGV